MSVKINSLEIENVKRIKAVKLEPKENGLTIIGGKNEQGKTSVLDSIAWVLGGDKFRPSEPNRKDSVIPPNLHIVMSNGIIVERKGKNSSLKVTDPAGTKSGQQLLNEFIEQLALDIPKFMDANSKDKAKILLQVIGVGDKLYELDTKEQMLYNKRHAIGVIADQKQKYANEMPEYPDAPSELVSISDLISQQQAILAKNGENKRLRDNMFSIMAERNAIAHKVNRLKEELEKAEKELAVKEKELTTASKTAEQLQDESTEELEKSISNIELINERVRANLNRSKAEDEAKNLKDEYDKLTEDITKVRNEKTDLLKSADLPLPELSIQDGELTYKGYKWDNMSGSEQLKVATAIVRKLNPQCGFVLLDKLEQMDLDSLKEFGEWLEAEGLQAIATRVSTGDECSIIIEDGYVVSEEKEIAIQKTWTEGEF